MNTTELLRPLKGVAATVFSFLAGIVSAETVTVDSVAELVSNLDRLNRDRNTAHTIILAEGSYDVSACAMEADTGSAFEASKSHLCVSHLTLKGATANPRDTVIYGNGSNRIFFCNAGTIESLTVSNGYHATENGAGVLARWQKATTLTNAVVTCCNAPAGTGGALYFLTYVRDCQIVGNSAKYGGGVGNIQLSPFADSGVYGGNVSGNHASVGGGGIMCANVFGVTVARNTSDKRGGGIFINVGNHIEGGTIVSNKSSLCGGGVYFAGSTSAYITNATVACNSTYSAGGGIYVANNDSCVFDCTVSNNVCQGVYDPNETGYGGGGGICRGKIYRCTIVGNSVTDNSVTGDMQKKNSGHGGGLLAPVYAGGCDVVGNTAVNGGGGVAKSQGPVVACTISNNLAHCYGGGVYQSAVTDSDIVFNLVHNTKGMTRSVECGAGACESFVTNSTVSGNACVIGKGGGGYDTEFCGCSIFENYSSTGAGMEKGRAVKCSFRDNATLGGATIFRSTQGFVDCDIQGAVFDWPGYLVNCRVHGYDMDGYATIAEGANVYTSGVFKANSISGTSPNLLYAVNGFGVTGMAATNTIFYNNRTTCFFWPASLHASFVNCQFVSNSWHKTCIGVGMDSGNSAEFVNSIFAGNCNTTRTAFVEWNPDSKGDTNIVMRYCLFGSGSRSNLPRFMENCRFDTDVKFKDDGKWPYQPSRLSLAAGNGLPQDWMENATDIRGEGYPRLSDGKVDIGAYQYHRKVTGLEIFIK
jgi:hypothetical protein